MSIGSIGSSPSFYQQDQDYWNQAKNEDAATSADNALINVMGNAEVTLAKGLASIANKTALNRVNSQISALVEKVLNPSGSSTSSTGSSASSTSSSTTSSASASASSSASAPALPATGTGTVLLTTSTPLSTIGILPGGTVTFSAGNNATTYTSTGTDTVGDLISAVNIDLPTNAQVTASLNSKGQLVITSRNNKDSIAIVGSGTDAAVLGFGGKNAGFQPTKAGASAAASSSTSSTSSSSSSSSATVNPVSKVFPFRSASMEQGLSTAANILSSAGVTGTLVNLLA
jgi:hypothetical protein